MSPEARPPRVAVVIPALDEEQAIGGVLDALDRGLVAQLLVADNGSRDRTAELARAHGAEVVLVPERGYGAACLGALARVAPEIEVVAFMDADGADDPAELASLVEPIARGEADLVIGSRVLGRAERGSLTPPQRFGNWLATRLIHLLHGQRYTDLGRPSARCGAPRSTGSACATGASAGRSRCRCARCRSARGSASARSATGAAWGARRSAARSRAWWGRAGASSAPS